MLLGVVSQRPLFQLLDFDIFPPYLDPSTIVDLQCDRSFARADLRVLYVDHLFSVQPFGLIYSIEPYDPVINLIELSNEVTDGRRAFIFVSSI